MGITLGLASPRAGEVGTSAPSPKPFTDKRFRAAILARKLRQVMPHVPPFVRTEDIANIHHARELQKSDRRGRSFFPGEDRLEVRNRYYGRIQGLIDGTVRPETFQDKLYKEVFSRRPQLIEDALEKGESFSLYEGSGGSVNPARLASAEASTFDEVAEWFVGNFEGNDAQRTAALEGMQQDYKWLRTQAHEATHLALGQEKYQKFFAGNKLKEETVVRAMDVFYAPKILREGVVDRMNEKLLLEVLGRNSLKKPGTDRDFTNKEMVDLIMPRWTRAIERIERL